MRIDLIVAWHKMRCLGTLSRLCSCQVKMSIRLRNPACPVRQRFNPLTGLMNPPQLIRLTGLLLTLPLLLPATEISSNVNPDAIWVAKFKGDRLAALSFTLDDNLRDQYDVAVPLLNKYGIHATFFVISGRTADTNEEAAKKKPGDWGGISWPQLKELAAQGHEIANHTWMHTQLINSKDGSAGESNGTKSLSKAQISTLFLVPIPVKDESEDFSHRDAEVRKNSFQGKSQDMFATQQKCYVRITATNANMLTEC